MNLKSQKTSLTKKIYPKINNTKNGGVFASRLPLFKTNILEQCVYNIIVFYEYQKCYKYIKLFFRHNKLKGGKICQTHVLVDAQYPIRATIVVATVDKNYILAKVKLCHHAHDAPIKLSKKKPAKTKITTTKKVKVSKMSITKKGFFKSLFLVLTT